VQELSESLHQRNGMKFSSADEGTS